MFHPHMVKVHMNNKLYYSSFCPCSLHSIGTEVSSFPDACPANEKQPATVSLQAQVSIAILCGSFCQGKQPLCKRNDSLRVSTGPSIAFELYRVTQTESEHKNLLISCHVTRLMAALQDKTLSDNSPSLSF